MRVGRVLRGERGRWVKEERKGRTKGEGREGGLVLD